MVLCQNSIKCALLFSRLTNTNETPKLKRTGDADLERQSISRKRRKTSECSVHSKEPGSPLSSIIQAVENLSTDSDLIADGSRVGCLPTVAGKHRDLKSISSQTVCVFIWLLFIRHVYVLFFVS